MCKWPKDEGKQIELLHWTWLLNFAAYWLQTDTNLAMFLLLSISAYVLPSLTFYPVIK